MTWTASRQEAAAQADNVAQINALARDGMREVSEARAIDGSVAEAVRALQFEDIATRRWAARTTWTA